MSCPSARVQDLGQALVRDAWTNAYASMYPPCDSGIHGVTCGAVPFSLAATQPGFLAYAALQQRKTDARATLSADIAQSLNAHVCAHRGGGCASDNGEPAYYDLMH